MNEHELKYISTKSSRIKLRERLKQNIFKQKNNHSMISNYFSIISPHCYIFCYYIVICYYNFDHNFQKFMIPLRIIENLSVISHNCELHS